jgi:plastocyanin
MARPSPFALVLTIAMSVVGIVRASQGPLGGGTVRGRVTVPDMAVVAPRPSVSGLMGSSHIPVDRRRVVVFLESTAVLTSYPKTAGHARMDQRDEQFVPRLLAITTGSTVEFPNNDTTFHNVFSLSRPKSFDLGRYPPGRNGAIRFDRPGIVAVFCDIHSHMSAYILVFDHPFFAVSDTSGRYAIRDIPAGTYGLGVWSELGQAKTRRITIAADSTVEADFDVDGDTR